MTEELLQKFYENGRKRSWRDVLLSDCFEQLGEHEQEQVVEDIINAPVAQMDSAEVS